MKILVLLLVTIYIVSVAQGEKCWFDPVRPESCPSDPRSLKKCTVPKTKGELCEAGFPWPAGTDNINNCGYSEVYSTDCEDRWTLTETGRYCHPNIYDERQDSLIDCQTHCQTIGARRLTFYPDNDDCRCCSPSSELKVSSIGGKIYAVPEETTTAVPTTPPVSGMIRVTSTGEDASSPHCSWRNTCQYDDASKGKCANALCKAKGYHSGSFVDSSNNFCDVSFTSDTVFLYLVDTDRIEQLNQAAEARITADCVAA